MVNAMKISAIIGGRIVGGKDIDVTRASPISSARSDSVTFCSKHGPEGAEIVSKTTAGIVICSNDVAGLLQIDGPGKTLIAVDNPRMAMITLVKELFAEPRTGISKLAFVEKGTKIGRKVYIGPFCHIEKCTQIGNNVKIDSGTVIGKEGFGYERDEKGALVRFPHIGRVIIEDDVEIGSNVVIDRGTLGDTLIGKGTKVDNLCHIAHNVQIGIHCMITAQCMLAGSSKVGDYSYMAPCASVRDETTIGRNAFVGMGAVVLKDVADGWIVYGTPAKPIRQTEKKFGFSSRKSNQ